MQTADVAGSGHYWLWLIAFAIAYAIVVMGFKTECAGIGDRMANIRCEGHTHRPNIDVKN